MGIITHFSLGIVGHAADKFTSETEKKAKQAIRELIRKYSPTCIISGGCHLGGIDIWAEEIAEEEDVPTTIYKPARKSWEHGYKPRNLQIANNSDLVVCIVVKEYPPNYNGMRFDGCYHCGNRNTLHVKSGGCYTAWRCKRREWIVIG